MHRRKELASKRCVKTFAAMLVTLATMLACVLIGPVHAQAAEYNIGELGWVDKGSSKLTIVSGGQEKPFISGTTVDYGDEINMQLHWNVPNNITVKSGDTFVYDLPENLTFQSGQQYDIINESGDVVGHYVINGNRMVATYTRGEDAGSNVTAYVTVKGTINSDKTGGNNGGDKTFSYPGYGDVTLKVNPKHEVNASKSAAISTSDPSKWEFVIKVNSVGTNQNVQLNDTMGELMKLDPDSIHIYTDADCQQPYEGTWNATPAAGNTGFSATIKSMEDGETLYVRYAVTADRATLVAACKQAGDCSQVPGLKNSVEYHSDDNTDHKKTENSIWVTYKDWSVTKGGTQTTIAKSDPQPGDPNNKKDVSGIQWTINITKGTDTDISGASIKDALGNGLKEPSGDVILTCRKDNDWKTQCPTNAPGAFESDPYNNQWSIKVPWLDLVKGTYTLPSGFDSFAITYTTEVTNAPNADSGEHRTYTNDVKVTPKDHPSKDATGTADVGKDVVNLVKKCTSPRSESKNLTWVTSLTALTAMDNVDLKDTLDQKGDGSSAGFQQSLVQNSIAVYADEAMTQRIDASAYLITATDHDFTITFNHLNANQTVYVAYQSTVKDGVTAETVYNTAESKHKTATASHTHQVDNLEKDAVNQYWDQYGYGQTANAAGVLRWLLTVHDLPEKAQSVTISDTLPENTMFVPGSVKAVSPNAKTTTLSGVSAKDNGNGTVTFTISPGTAAFKQATTTEGLQIVYDTRVDALKAQEGYHEYTNKAHISVDGNDQTDQSYKLGMNTPKLVSKQGTYNESTAPNVNYTVKINPGAQTLNNGKALTLTDTLGSALDLRMDSILIADSASGKQINGATWSYEPNSKKLVFFIPDKRAVTITYKATVQLKAGETIEGAVGRNEISLEGVDASKGSDTSTVTGTVKTAQGGMTFDSNTLQIYKYIDGDTGRPGANAMFEVQEVNVDLTKCSTAAETAGKKTCSGTVGKTVMNNLTTGTTGYSSQVQLNADRIYKVTELVAPGEKAGEDSAYEKAKPLYVVFPGHDAIPDGKTYDHRYDNLTITDDKDSGLLKVAVANNATLGNYLWYVNNDHKEKTKISIAKLDAADVNVPVAGATLRLSKWGSSETPDIWSNWTSNSMPSVSKSEDGLGLTWTTNTGKQDFELLPGRYRLEETEAPIGYKIMDPITINVGADGTVTVNGHDMRDTNGVGQVQALDVPKTTTLTVTKEWNDNNNQDGKRRTVTFDLYRKLAGESDFTKVKGQSRDVNVTVGDSTAYWQDLPVMVNGKKAEYKAVESTELDGYTSSCTAPAVSADGSATTMTCTNTHTPKTINLGVYKQWDDANNQDGIRPSSITAYLVKNGVKTDKSVTLNADDNWENANAFPNLPVYENGVKVAYGVEEDVPSGYTVTTSGIDRDHDITLTNTHHPNNQEVWFSKQNLGKEEISGATMKLTGKLDDKTKTFESRLWVSNGTPHSFKLEPGTYTLTETAAPAGYTKADDIVFRVKADDGGKLQVQVRQSDGSYASVADGLITMIDVYKPHRVTINKNSLTNGVTNIAGAHMSVTGRTLAGKTIDSIEWVTEQGKPQQLDLQPGNYTLSETQPPTGYTMADDIAFTVDINGNVIVDGKTQQDATLTMKDKPDTNGIFFSKTAVGGGAELAGAEFSVTGSTFEGKEIYPITWTSGGTMKQFMLKDGVYMLTETKAPTGYEAVKPFRFTVSGGKVYIDDVLQSDRTVHVEDRIDTIMVRVRKVWSDLNYSGRPSSVTFHLLRDAKELTGKQYTVNVDNSSSWTHTWTDLPRYDENGERYNYTVDEETTQKLKDGSYRVSITKRPYQDGAEYTVLNVREPDAINAKVTKTWEDNANNDGKRPTKLTFHVWGTSDQPKDPTDLTQGFEARTEQIIVQDVNVSSDADKQFWTFEGLPKQNIYGKSYTYTVTEESVDGYTTSGCSTDADGTNGSDAKAAEQRTGCVFTPTGSSTEKEKDFQVTNKHTPETTTLNVTKQWDDDSDSDNGRPNSLTIWVLSSIWNGKNDQPLPGWPTPQNNSMCSDPKDTKAKNPVGVSCAVLTKDNAKNAVTTTEASSDGAKETAGSSGSDTTNVASNEWAYAFTNLPKYYKGKEIHYSVTEEAVNGYKPVSLTGGKTVPQQPNQSETGADESNAQTAAADPNTATDESQDSTDGTNATAESWNYQLTNKYTAVKLPSTGGEGDGTYMRVGLIALLVGTLCLAMALRRKERD